MRKLVITLIKFYQKYLSLDKGPLKFLFPGVCRFTPTCSQYTINAVYKYGVLKGLYRGFKRIIRCTPFSKGGNDPVK